MDTGVLTSFSEKDNSIPAYAAKPFPYYALCPDSTPPRRRIATAALSSIVAADTCPDIYEPLKLVRLVSERAVRPPHEYIRPPSTNEHLLLDNVNTDLIPPHSNWLAGFLRIQ